MAAPGLVLLALDPPKRVRRKRDGTAGAAGAPQPQDIAAGDDDEYYSDDYDTSLVEVKPARRNPLLACLLWPCTSAVRAPILCFFVSGPVCPCLWCGGKVVGDGK